MINRGLTFSIIQIITILLSLFVFGFTLAGSHGRLYFSNGGGTVALIITIILSLPLLYLFFQGHYLKNKNLLFIIAIAIFGFAMTVVYVGLPTMTKQFIIDTNNINNVSIYRDNGLTIDFKLQQEIFDRVSIEAHIKKESNIELKKLYLTISNNKGEIIKPVFPPLAWDSLNNETIQMQSFFETNDYTKMNQFSLTGQFSIESIDSLEMKIDLAFTKSGQLISKSKQVGIGIANHLMLSRLIEY